jgi:hypothetical protein
MTTTVYDTDGTPWHAGDYPERSEEESFGAYTERLLREVRDEIVKARDNYGGATSTRLVEHEHEAAVVVRVESDDRTTWHAYIATERAESPQTECCLCGAYLLSDRDDWLHCDACATVAALFDRRECKHSSGNDPREYEEWGGKRDGRELGVSAIRNRAGDWELIVTRGPGPEYDVRTSTEPATVSRETLARELSRLARLGARGAS